MLAAPVLAGVLVEANLWGIGWRLVFLINVPIGIATFLGSVRVLPRTIAHPGIRLDKVGMVLIGIALTAIVYPLIEGREAGWPAWTFLTLAAGAAVLAVFLLWERRTRGDALIEPSLLSNHTYISGILVALATFGAFGGLLLCVSLFTQLGEGFSPIHAGLTLIPMVIGMVVGMGVSFALVGRLGRHLIHLGVFLIAAGAAVLALPLGGAESSSTWDLAPGLALIGLGAGASLGQLFDFILAGVTMDEVGSASGVLEAVQQLSSAIGVAALGTIFFSAFSHHLPTHALAITAWACLVPLAAAFALAFRLPMQAARGGCCGRLKPARGQRRRKGDRPPGSAPPARIR